MSSPLLTSGKRWFRRCLSALRLRRVAGPSSDFPGPVLFAIVRNEMLRLPRFLDHYRTLGVGRFYVVANNCTDDTETWLKGQKDVCLYRTRETFLRKEAWLDVLFRRHGIGRWCLVADADELLEYPCSSQVNIGELCAYLESRGENALHAILLDLYPGMPLAEVGYRAGENYFLREWYFDPLHAMRKVPRAFFRGSGLDYRLEGGSRERLFGVKSCCSKFPLFHYERGMFLSDGQHYIEGGRISALRGVMYHFKYLQDFAPHVREEVQRGQHWQGAREYKVYAQKLEGVEKTDFRTQDSIRLTGGAQLESLGFLIRPEDFNERFPAAANLS